MRVRLPNLSSTAAGPIWQAETGPHAPAHAYPNPSTHQGDFLRHGLPPIASCKAKTSAYISRLPLGAAPPTGPIHDPFDAPRRRNLTRRPELTPGAGAMDGLSNYRQEFTRKTAERPTNYKPVEVALKSDEPFSGGSIYRAQFKRWDPAPAPIKPLSSEAKYAVAKCSNDAPVRPEARAAGGPDLLPFASETSYSTAFRLPRRDDSAGLHGQRYRSGPVPGDDSDAARVQPCGPFVGCSVYRSDFVPKEVAPPRVLQNLSALTYDSAHRPPSRVQPFVEHADHVFYSA